MPRALSPSTFTSVSCGVGSSGGQFLSSQRGNLGGVLTYDAPGSTHWTARWPSLGAADNAFALAGSIIGAWTGPAGAPPTAGGEQTNPSIIPPRLRPSPQGAPG